MKTSKLILSIILILISFVLIKKSFKKNNLPDVAYFDLTGKEIQLKEIEYEKKNIYIFYINPSCNSCMEINKVFDTINHEKNKTVLISSYFKGTNYSEYKEKFNLPEQSLFLIDKKNVFLNDFDIMGENVTPIILFFENEN